LERAGLKPGLYNSEAKNAGRVALRKDSGQAGAAKMGLKQKRPDEVGAHFSTGILYHNGKGGQVKKLEAKERRVKTPALKSESGAPGKGSTRHRCGERIMSTTTNRPRAVSFMKDKDFWQSLRTVEILCATLIMPLTQRIPRTKGCA